MSSVNDEMAVELDAEAKHEAVGGKLDFRYALQKFRKYCENFAIPAKFRYEHFFAKLAKFFYHSENSLS